MEAIKHILFGFRLTLQRVGWLLVLFLSSAWSLYAQTGDNTVTFKSGKLYITIKTSSEKHDLFDFFAKYNLDDLALMSFVANRDTRKLKDAGWKIVNFQGDILVISKAMETLGDFSNPMHKIRITDTHGRVSELYPLGVNTNKFGYNQLKNEKALQPRGDSMVFFLPDYGNAFKVELAGSFSRWQYKAFTMVKAAGGWTITLPLAPGKHFYKYIVDGRWINDPGNQLMENDGKGNDNSVAFMPNRILTLMGYRSNRKVFLAGSFNGWQPRNIAMQRSTVGWQLPVFFPEGTFTYRYVVDHEWITDPQAKTTFLNEFGEPDAVIQIGKPYVFRLNGFENAGKVVLSGSFNNWDYQQLRMQKVPGGWEFMYTPGSGNHIYHYLVDGREVGSLPDGKSSSFSKELFTLIVAADYTFTLEGFSNATNICIAGTFNNWSEKGFPMRKNENGQWAIKLHVPAGKSAYKFVVDGQWIIDPKNLYWEQNEVGSNNSFLWRETP